jgi:NAD(P)H-dependent flavin oxidoreductase YrpB (nitropropane dioxygenase family)
MLAGMGGGRGGYAGPELVAAVCEAGGFGVLGAESLSPNEIHEACAKVRSLTKRPFGVDILLPNQPSTSGRTPAGQPPPTERYEQWLAEAMRQLELKQPPPPATPAAPSPWTTAGLRKAREPLQVEAIIQEKVRLFAAGLGSPGPYVKRLHEAGITVLGLVGNVRNARRVRDDGADIIVAQGYEAGGHTGRVGTFALVPQVVDAVAPAPVVAAGGIGDGRGVAAALALGAQGVWVGTAFLATHEANARPEHKRRLVERGEEDTRITRFYSGKTMRNLHNAVVDLWDVSGLPPLPLQPVLAGRLQAAALASGRDDLLVEPAGQITGMVRQIRPAADVLDEMVREAVEVLASLTRQRVTIAIST